ncbi:MAG: carboxypeptidase T [Myxococcota bacterium]
MFTTTRSGSDPAPADTPGLFLDLHSYSELILWPWGAISEPAPNAEALATLGHRMGDFTGYTPQPMIDLYPTDGTSIDHVYGTTGVASYTIEIGTAFFQTCDSFDEALYPPLRDMLRYAATVADALYRTPAGPEVTADLLPDDRHRFTLTASAEQPIAAAQYTVDVPPGMPDAVPVTMTSAADGKMLHAATIRGRKLSTGRHTLYVRAQSEDGHWGPPDAVFIEVP